MLPFHISHRLPFHAAVSKFISSHRLIHWHAWVCIQDHDAAVSHLIHWPALVCIGLHWPALACIGLHSGP